MSHQIPPNLISQIFQVTPLHPFVSILALITPTRTPPLHCFPPDFHPVHSQLISWALAVPYWIMSLFYPKLLVISDCPQDKVQTSQLTVDFGSYASLLSSLQPQAMLTPLLWVFACPGSCPGNACPSSSPAEAAHSFRSQGHHPLPLKSVPLLQALPTCPLSIKA